MNDKAQGDGTAVVEVEEASETREPVFIGGDFETFEEAREYASLELDIYVGPGDLAVVNGGLCRVDHAGDFKILNPDLLAEYELPGDHVERFGQSLEQIEMTVLGAEFGDGALVDTVRDVMLDLYKARPKGWDECSQMEKRDLSKKLELAGKDIIRRVTRVVAEGEEVTVSGKLEQYTHKDGFTLKIVADGDEEAAVQLFKMVGHDIVIVSADASRFSESLVDAVPPDQAEMFEEEPEELAEQPPEDDSDLAGEVDENEEAKTENGPEASETPENGGEQVDESDKPAAKKPSHGDVKMKPVDEPEEKEPEEGAGSKPDAPDEEHLDEDEPEPQGKPSHWDDDDDEDPASADHAAADYVGEEEPSEAEIGESWVNTAADDQRPRYLHKGGKWLLRAPTEAELKAWGVSSSSEDEFPA